MKRLFRLFIRTSDKDFMANTMIEALSEKVVFTSDELDKLGDLLERFFDKTFIIIDDPRTETLKRECEEKKNEN